MSKQTVEHPGLSLSVKPGAVEYYAPATPMIVSAGLEATLPEKILVTAALPYANGPLHVGHLAGAYIPADVYVRYKRLKGSDIVFICGSDEHGVPITIRADKENVSPKEIVDRYHAMMKKSFEGIGVAFDNYSRTSL